MPGKSLRGPLREKIEAINSTHVSHQVNAAAARCTINTCSCPRMCKCARKARNKKVTQCNGLEGSRLATHWQFSSPFLLRERPPRERQAKAQRNDRSLLAREELIETRNCMHAAHGPQNCPRWWRPASAHPCSVSSLHDNGRTFCASSRDESPRYPSQALVRHSTISAASPFTRAAVAKSYGARRNRPALFP